MSLLTSTNTPNMLGEYYIPIDGAVNPFPIPGPPGPAGATGAQGPIGLAGVNSYGSWYYAAGGAPIPAPQTLRFNGTDIFFSLVSIPPGGDAWLRSLQTQFASTGAVTLYINSTDFGGNHIGFTASVSAIAFFDSLGYAQFTYIPIGPIPVGFVVGNVVDVFDGGGTVGPIGPAGPTGAAGANGTPGAQGATGATGPAGTPGSDANAAIWATFPAVQNVDVSGFNVTNVNTINTGTLGSTNIDCYQTLVTGFGTLQVGSPISLAPNPGTVNVNGTLTVQRGNANFYANALGIEFDGTSSIPANNSVKFGALPVSGLNTCRFEMNTITSPSGISIVAPSFVTIDAIGAVNLTAGIDAKMSAGGVVTLESALKDIRLQGTGGSYSDVTMFGGTLSGMGTIVGQGGGGVAILNVNQLGGLGPAAIAVTSNLDVSSNSIRPGSVLDISGSAGAATQVLSAGTGGQVKWGPGLGSGTNYSDYLFWNPATSSWAPDGSRVHIGTDAGLTTQGTNTVAVGRQAGGSIQGSNAVSVGAHVTTAQANQGSGAVSVGYEAGRVNQAGSAVAIGINAGENNQQSAAVAIGSNSAISAQGANAIAIGSGSGSNAQQQGAIAIGQNAADNSQQALSIAIGRSAGVLSGATGQQTQSIAIGSYAGAAQGTQAVTVGHYAVGVPQAAQGARGVSIGYNATPQAQGANAIAIGANATPVSPAPAQAANTVVINATNTAISTPSASATYITPIRTAYGTDVLNYTSTSEVVKQPNRFDASGNLTLPTQGISDASGAFGTVSQALYSTGTGVAWRNLPLVWGSFSSTTSQIVSAINTTTLTTFNTSDVTPTGVALLGALPTSQIQVSVAVTKLRIQSSIIIGTTASGGFFRFWLKQNGVNVPNTTSIVTIQNANDNALAVCEWFVAAAANDIFEVAYQSDNATGQIIAVAAGGVAPDDYPATPSIITTLMGMY